MIYSLLENLVLYNKRKSKIHKRNVVKINCLCKIKEERDIKHLQRTQELVSELLVETIVNYCSEHV